MQNIHQVSAAIQAFLPLWTLTNFYILPSPVSWMKVAKLEFHIGSSLRQDWEPYGPWTEFSFSLAPKIPVERSWEKQLDQEAQDRGFQDEKQGQDDMRWTPKYIALKALGLFSLAQKKPVDCSWGEQHHEEANEEGDEQSSDQGDEESDEESSERRDALQNDEDLGGVPWSDGSIRSKPNSPKVAHKAAQPTRRGTL